MFMPMTMLTTDMPKVLLKLSFTIVKASGLRYINPENKHELLSYLLLKHVVIASKRGLTLLVTATVNVQKSETFVIKEKSQIKYHIIYLNKPLNQIFYKQLLGV